MNLTNLAFRSFSKLKLITSSLALVFLAVSLSAEVVPAYPNGVEPMYFFKGYVGHPLQVMHTAPERDYFVGPNMPYVSIPPPGPTEPAYYRRYIATGLPLGMKLTQWGEFQGVPTRPGIYTVNLRVWNGGGIYSPIVTKTLEVLPTIPAKLIGNYQAILDPHPWYNGGFGGMFRMTLASNGTFTASLTRGRQRNSFKGKLALQPEYVHPNYVESLQESYHSIQVPRSKPSSPLYLDIHISSSADGIRLALAEPFGDVISFEGTRTHFNSQVPATNFAGQWNTAFEPEPPLVGYAAYPQGSGWAIQQVSTSGVITSTCRLADGTSFTQSSHIDPTGRFPLHAMLYGSKGSIQGWQTLNSSNSTTTGTLRWVKSPMMGRIYAAGFPAHSLNALGARYTPPTPGSLIFGITAGNDNARILFSQGGLSRDLSQTFTVTDKNVFLFPSGIDNPYGLRANFNVALGLFSGTGSSIDYRRSVYGSARSGSFSAILIPGRNEAVGHFLLPADTSRHSAILSGKLIGQENSSQAE